MGKLGTLFRVLTYSATGSPVLARAITASRVFVTSSAGLSLVAKQVGKPFAVATTGLATMSRAMVKVLSVVSSVTPSVVKFITKNPFTVSSAGSATLGKAITAARVFTTTATGTAKMLTQIADNVLNRLAGGATAVVNTIFSIFE